MVSFLTILEKDGIRKYLLQQIVICETKSIFRNTILFNQDDLQKNTVKHDQGRQNAESDVILVLRFDNSKFINITVHEYYAKNI